MLNDRPHDVLEDLSSLSTALAGRPMSDAVWVINEAARQTARAKQDTIRESALADALRRLLTGIL